MPLTVLSPWKLLAQPAFGRIARSRSRSAPQDNASPPHWLSKHASGPSSARASILPILQALDSVALDRLRQVAGDRLWMLRICVVRWRTSWARLRIRSRKARSSGGADVPLRPRSPTAVAAPGARIAEIVAVLQTVVLLDRRGVARRTSNPGGAQSVDSQVPVVTSTRPQRLGYPQGSCAAPSRSAQDRCANRLANTM